jgi:hypothetical protein
MSDQNASQWATNVTLAFAPRDGIEMTPQGGGRYRQLIKNFSILNFIF